VAAQDATPSSTPVSGEWTFTDDKGVTVTLPSRPERLAIDVNAAAPLWDFGIKPGALFGWNVMADGSLNDAGGNIDPEGIPTVGNVNEPINVEQLIAAEPDLIITITTALDNNPEDYWSIDAALLEQVKAVAPLIAISTTGAANETRPSDAGKITERFAELAGLLGADLQSEELGAAKAAYDAAIENFSTVASEKADLTAMFLATGEDTHWVAWAPAWSDLSLYTELGMNVQEPETHDGWWEQISHEQALKYPTDLLFVSTRGSLTIDELKSSPTFGAHPAVKANQVFDWNQDTIHSYQGMTEVLDGIAGALESSTKAS
jgi:iron complex transport system substrate-binding protein